MRIYFIPNGRFWVIALMLVWLFFLLVATAAAQDGALPVIPADVITPEQGGALVLSSVLAIAAAFAGSALTATIVSALKLIVPPEWDAGLMKNVIGGLLTVVYWLAVKYGFGEMFKSVAEFLVVAVPAFITLYGTLAGSSMLHQQAVTHNVPLLGYKRRVMRVVRQE